jgi:hypothetical protein
MARAPGPTLGPGAPLFAGGLAPKSLGLGVWLWLQSALGCGEAPQLSAAIGLWSLGINAHPHCDFFLTPWWIWWNQLGTPYQNISKSNFHSDSFPSFPIFPPSEYVHIPSHKESRTTTTWTPSHSQATQAAAGMTRNELMDGRALVNGNYNDDHPWWRIQNGGTMNIEYCVYI